MRRSANPDATLLDFLQSTYEAAANSANGTAPPSKSPSSLNKHMMDGFKLAA